MSNNGFDNRIEEQIKSSLNACLNTGNFGGLKNVIAASIREVLKEAGEEAASSVKNASSDLHKSGTYYNSNLGYSYHQTGKTQTVGATGYKKPHSTPEESKAYIDELQAKRRALNTQKKQNPAIATGNAIIVNGKVLPTKFDPIGKVSCIVKMVGGIMGSIFFGILTLVFAGFSLAKGALEAAVIVFLALTGGSVYLLKTGKDRKELIDRARRFAQICGTNMYSKISSLSSAMGLSTKEVVKDIKKMLRIGFFPEGYLDAEETTLMLSNDLYRQYDLTKQYALIKEQEQSDNSGNNEIRMSLSPELRQKYDSMLAEGNAYIKNLHALNDEIPGETISQKLYSLEDVLKEIFHRLSMHPEQMERMHKSMNYYLPTMQKLVSAYAEYDKVSFPSEDILNAKSDIEQTLDTINEAFNQLLNNLFADSVLDVTTDAKVLETMLKNEGLAQDIKNN